MAKPRPVRGATLNHESRRFALPQTEADGDWLDAREGVDGLAPRLRTTVTVETPRTIISRNTSPDIPFDRSINPYRGCEHGCIYCFARPTHAYLDLSPGLDFESRLFAKPSAAALLRAELGKPGYVAKPMALGTNTDPYQPIEREWRITRGIVEVLSETRHPLTITTKSDRVVRDIDLLGPMAAQGLASVAMSITSLDPKVAADAGAARAAPRTAADRGAAARGCGYPRLRLDRPRHPRDHRSRDRTYPGARGGGGRACRLLPARTAAARSRAAVPCLARRHFPDRAGKVMATIQSLRGGRDNDPDFFSRMRGQGPWGDLLRTRFHLACRRHGLNRERIVLRSDLFEPPQGPQGELF